MEILRLHLNIYYTCASRGPQSSAFGGFHRSFIGQI